MSAGRAVNGATEKRPFTKTHGMTGTPEYNAWRQMKARCRSRSAKRWAGYGERQIKVCERWENSFLNFYADMGPRPKGTSLGRMNNDKGGYEPGNCRWETREQQMNNTRNNRRITWRGETLTLTQWARQRGIRAETLQQRLDEWRWSVERALLTPVAKAPLISAKTLARWQRELGLSLLTRRLAKGWSLERALQPEPKAHLIQGRTIAAWASEAGTTYSAMASRVAIGWPAARLLQPARKRRFQKRLLIGGKNLSVWAREAGIPLTTMQTRLQLGWPIESAISARKGPRISRKMISAWAKELGLATIEKRLRRGWSAERAILGPVKKVTPPRKVRTPVEKERRIYGKRVSVWAEELGISRAEVEARWQRALHWPAALPGKGA